jgi:hypothetical protein
MILSLARFGIAPEVQTNTVEKGWAVHRKQHGLDLYGKSMVRPLDPVARCVHPQIQ